MSRSAYGQVEQGAIKPSLEMTVAVSEHFGIPLLDLLFGESKSGGSYASQSSTQLAIASESVTQYGSTPVVVTVDAGGNERIVLVDVKAAAGYPRELTDPVFYRKLPTFQLPGSEFVNATFRCFEVDGDSMSDTVNHGDWVIGQYLDNPLRNIREGYVHIIVTHSEVFIKRILNRANERGQLVLISDNDGYAPMQIPVEEVQEVWLVKRLITGLLLNRKRDLQRQINNLVSDLVDIRAQLGDVGELRAQLRMLNSKK